MRVLLAGVVFVSVGTGGCALIAGLSDYEGRAGAERSDSAGASPEDGSLALDDEQVSPSLGDAALASDAPWSVVDDAGDAALVPDVNTTCGPTTCAGCCSNGECVGGASVATCGVGGGACQDCTNMGGACTGGACMMKVADAGPPKTCTASKCGGCIPFYQTSCCKSDQTCGCVVSFSGGSCK